MIEIDWDSVYIWDSLTKFDWKRISTGDIFTLKTHVWVGSEEISKVVYWKCSICDAEMRDTIVKQRRKILYWEKIMTCNETIMAKVCE